MVEECSLKSSVVCAMGKYYAVKEGRRPGVYTSWDQAKAQVDKYPGAVHKKFNCLSDAQTFVGDPSARIYGSHALPPWVDAVDANSATALGRDSKRSRAEDEVVWVATKRPNHLLADSPPSRAASRSSRAVADTSPTLLIYTDGSCLGNRNVSTSNCPAGWAAVAVDPRNPTVAVAELYGPVITPSVRIEQPHFVPFDVGAEVGSNNTGELCGILEALVWVRSHFAVLPDTAASAYRKRIVEVGNASSNTQCALVLLLLLLGPTFTLPCFANKFVLSFDC